VRVAFQIDQLGFAAPGGIGTYVEQLLSAPADPTVKLVPFHAPFVHSPRVVLPTSSGRAGIELRTPVKVLYPLWDYLGVPPLPRSLRDCDIVHVTNPAGVAPARRGQALVVTVHDLAFEHFPDAFPPRWLRLYRAGLRAAVRRAAAILTPSRATADDLIARTDVDPARVHVTPLAAFGPWTDPDAEGDLADLGVRPPYLLFVGTLEPRKNVLRLVRAYRALAAEGLPHALVLNGPDGWGSEELARELALDRPGTILRTRDLREGVLDALYRGADAFAYPSLYEGFGLPVLEALQRGVPVVSSAVSSIPEVAGDAALLVDPTDDEALTDALRLALTDPAVQADLARRGPLQAARFSWPATARATLAVYRSVAGDRRRT
jgi:glycosyltransferase involved in cell wall biosynthesis